MTGRGTGWLLIGAALLACGCSSYDVNETLYRRTRAGYTRSLAAGALSMLERPRIDSYEIGPEDVLQVSILDLKQIGETEVLEVQVDLEGRVGLPLIGRVDADGKTSRQLREVVTERFGATFLQNPEVSINVKEYRSKRVAVLGAVTTPGVVTLRANSTTVVEAIALAGGVTEKAGRRALLVRGASGDNVAVAIEVDLESLANGDVSQNFPMSPGDVLNISAAERYYVTGFVIKPGEYPMGKTVTATEAIAAAGGLVTPDASPDLTVIRRFGQPAIAVDLSLVAAGVIEDPVLEPSDILEIRQGFWWGLALGFYRFVKNGIGFGYNLAAGIPPAF